MHPRLLNLCLIVLATCAGCYPVAQDERKPAGLAQDSSTFVRVSGGATPIAELAAAHRADGAAATRNFGDWCAVEFRADEVKKIPTGFVAVQRDGPRAEHRIYFRDDAASWLKAGDTYKIRGRVESTTPRGLLLYTY